MAESKGELGRAVADVLAWMDTTPEAAGAALGINARTLAAMTQGIVPMRSLIIKFAAGVAQQCAGREGAQDWWTDVDAWLAVAGYSPRREGVGDKGEGAWRRGPANGRPEHLNTRTPEHQGPSPQRPTPNADPASEPETPARDFYHPVYERLPWGDTFVHIFRILDANDRDAFRINMPAREDYKARAAQVKQDLANLGRAQFERKYGRFRVNER
jgi:hypothetical protein